MANLSSSWETIQSTLLDVDSRMAEWAGLKEQREGTGLLAAVCSLAAVWITWKFLLRCRFSLKLRHMSRTVPSIRRVGGLRSRASDLFLLVGVTVVLPSRARHRGV